MHRWLGLTILFVSTLLLSQPVAGLAQEKIEGTVASTTLTACAFKPGTCEGSLVLETKAAGKPAQVSIKVPKGTQIKQGNEYLFLPGLKGRQVAITYVAEKGEKIARSIDVKAPKP